MLPKNRSGQPRLIKSSKMPTVKRLPLLVLSVLISGCGTYQQVPQKEFPTPQATGRPRGPVVTVLCRAGLDATIDGTSKRFNTISARVTAGGMYITANTGSPTEYVNITVPNLTIGQTGTFSIPRNRAQFVAAGAVTFNSLPQNAAIVITTSDNVHIMGTVSFTAENSTNQQKVIAGTFCIRTITR